MIRTIWNDPERFKKSYFPEELKGYLPGRRRRRAQRRPWLLPHHRPH
jgi:acyl-coenzyme A synthetase/AMP-(fatty) acid ligase